MSNFDSSAGSSFDGDTDEDEMKNKKELIKNTKYLKATDFLEIQMMNVLEGQSAFAELAKITIAMIDILDLNKTIAILFDNDMQEVLFTSIKLLSWRDGLELYREELILKIFNESIARSQLHFSLRILAQFKNLVMININAVLPTLLKSLIDTPFYMDIKLSMVQQFLQKITFHHVEVLVNNLK